MSCSKSAFSTTLRLANLHSFHHRVRVQHCFVVGSCLAIANSQRLAPALGTTTTRCAPAKSPPARFGMSIRSNHSDSLASISSNQDKEDCPLCRKFSQGPCGELFKKWLACTEKYRGKMDSTSNEELHLSKCQHLALPMAECLEKYQEYYDNLDVYSDEAEEEILLQEWTKVVKQVEESHSCATSLDFPSSLTPELQIRSSDITGMAAFVYDHHDDNKALTLAYVKDADSGELLAAGSLDDFWLWQDKYGVLRLSIPPTTTVITACALYDDVLYCITQRVPPKKQQEDDE